MPPHYDAAVLHVLDLRGAVPPWRDRLPRPDLAEQGPVEEVRAILADVRRRGDEALRDYTRRFDQAELGALAVPLEELEAARSRLDQSLMASLGEARDAIAAFHRRHRPPVPPYERNGIRVDSLELPVARAGAYVPGGRASYPSSVLMTCIPPKVAGVGEVVLCVPPRPDGSLPDEVLAAAALAEVDEVYRVGGPQAIAAMAYGTESIPSVDVVAGAGSRRVSLAKEQVRGLVGVPAAFAGPSEVVVVADGSVPADFAAVDVVVQAEHGPDGLAWLVTWSRAALEAVDASVARLVREAPRRREIESTLSAGGYAVLVDGPGEAMAVANEIAPEHLELCCERPEELVPLVRNAGAVFLGPLSPASYGDYLAGPSHVLPTFGSARFASALGVEDFVRRVHVVSASSEALDAAGPHVEAIARAEGLMAHAQSIALRRRS